MLFFFSHEQPKITDPLNHLSSLGHISIYGYAVLSIAIWFVRAKCKDKTLFAILNHNMNLNSFFVTNWWKPLQAKYTNIVIIKQLLNNATH